MNVDQVKDATILIVDDNSTNLGVLFAYLSKFGFTLLMSQNGEQALELVKKRLPDIILLDVLMPGVDGFEVCRQLKEHSQTRDIPVIFMTALADTIDKLKGFAVGGVDYITKPFQQEEVVARVNAQLTVRKLQQQLQDHNAQLKARSDELTATNIQLQTEIADRKKAEAKLVVANQELQEALDSLKQAQTQLLHSERMAALGQLVSGVAHEINTPAGVIVSAIGELDRVYAQLSEQLNDTLLNLPRELRALYLDAYHHVLFTEQEMATRERRAEAKAIQKLFAASQIEVTHNFCHQLASIGFSEHDIERLFPLFSGEYRKQVYHSLYVLGIARIHVKNIKKATHDIIQIVNALKHYSHLDEGKLVRTNLEEDLENTLLLLKHTLRTITMHKEYGDISQITCYAAQLNQVWTSLIQNAVHAMKGKGELVLRLKQVNEQEVAVEVEDTGPGIPTKFLPYIFDPYFTTWQEDKRIGMGLTICRHIVEHHQGRIAVVSSIPGKTCFQVVLPVFTERQIS